MRNKELKIGDKMGSKKYGFPYYGGRDEAVFGP